MSKLKIAVQKSGRLNEDSMKILKAIGISIDNGKDQLKASARNFPLEVFYLRNGDIPQYLADGVVDVAIIGSNVLAEKGNSIKSELALGFSRCRVSVAVPKTTPYSSIKDLNGKKMSASMQVRDAFGTSRTITEKENTNLKTVSFQEPITPMVSIALSMRLNNYNRKQARPDSSDEF